MVTMITALLSIGEGTEGRALVMNISPMVTVGRDGSMARLERTNGLSKRCGTR